MPRLSSSKQEKCRGIIVWDFDGVLFNTERFKRNVIRIFAEHGVPPRIFEKAIQEIKKGGTPFSIGRVLRTIRSLGIKVQEKSLRRSLYNHLFLTSYFTKNKDDLLRRLKSRGLRHIILSSGASSYQRKKIKVGCGEDFVRCFDKILTTTRPKHYLLFKLQKKFCNIPLIFVDDTRENLLLAKKHVPHIKTIYYSNLSRETLKNLEEKILKYVQSKRG